MIVTVGEVLVVMGSAESGPLPRGDAFELSVAGAEPNVAIGAARLSSPVAYAGRVGDDAFGRLAARTAVTGALRFPA